MKTFYFNTGVNVYGYHNPPIPIMEGEVISPNGIKLIPFDCDDVPENAIFAFACADPNLKNHEGFIIREIHNSTLLSKYAYFKP